MKNKLDLKDSDKLFQESYDAFRENLKYLKNQGPIIVSMSWDDAFNNPFGNIKDPGPVFQVGQKVYRNGDRKKEGTVLQYDISIGQYQVEYVGDDGLKTREWTDGGGWWSNIAHCWHNWKEYIGFTERYYYCTKCDEKKGTK